MKKYLLVLLSLSVSALFVGLVVTPSSAGPTVLKFSTVYEETNPMTTSMQWFGKELEKRTGGRYQAKFFFSGMLGKASDLPELCKNGAADFIFTGLGYTPHLFKLSRGFELMYITENPHAGGAAFWDMYQNYKPLRDEWDKNGLMIVFPAGVDIMACQSRQPTNKPEDCRGMKIRSYAAVADMISMWGGTPIAISYAEIYDALNRGVLDAAFGIPTLNVYASRFWEVAPCVFNTGAGMYAITFFAMSKRVYDRFPEDVKTIVNALREEGMARHREWMVQTEKEVFKKLHAEKNIKIINWSPEEKARAKAMLTPKIWQNWLDEMKKANLPGEEFLKKYRELVEKYEKQYSYTDPFTY